MTATDIEKPLQINVAGIVDESVVDGSGIRFVLFAQGCYHNCKNCHNVESHSFEEKQLLTPQQIMAMIDKNPLLSGITLSGGEPFEQAAALAQLAQLVRGKGMNVWTYTGYTYQQLTEKALLDNAVKQLLNSTDILVDGKFVEELKDLKLVFRGSSNQRLLKLTSGKVIGELDI